MTKNVFFRTNLVKNKIFKPDLFYNEYFGEDLAKWLVGNFPESEFTFSEPYRKDWGWEIEAKKDQERFYLWLFIESIGEETLEWWIMLEKPKSWLSFRKQNTSHFEKLCKKIDEILINEPQISEVSWYL